MKKAICFIIVLITSFLTLTPKLYAHLPAPVPPPANTIFVATDGDDSYTGSYTAPVKSLNRALYLAGIDGTIDQIYIAVGTYNETNILELRSNLLIEGGFDRNNNWAKTGLATIININSIEHIDANISHKIGFRSNNDTYWIIKDLTIFVASATTGDRSVSGRGASVYGLYITGNGAGNQIINCSITAGNGGTGANGINGANGATGNTGSDGEKGGCANSNGNGGSGGSTIGSGIRAGGGGGSGSRGGEGGAFSTAYGSSAGNSGIRGGSGSGGAYGTGGAGAPAKNNGYPGNPGGNGANGTLTVINPTFNWGGYFTPAAQGATGSDGYGGGGAGGGSGGGGAGSYSRGGGGGGGGGGGQGGAGGTGGHGGGGSFVLFCYNSSTPEISGTTLVKGNGGAGGTGGSGGIGGNGGVGGAGVGAATCSGKTGGNGGTGGKGGNGAAGENGTAGTSEIIAFVNNSTLVTHDISIPIVRDDESCSSSINISAIPGYGGTTCRWYDVNQTTLLATTTTFSTTISGNTTFYVATYNANISYESTEKVPINIILHPTPGIPGTTPDSRCEPGTVNLAATPGSNGTTCRWYTDITCTNLIHTGNSYSPFLNNTTSYYVTSYNESTGCEGQPTTITGTVLFNSPNTYVAGEICQGATYHQYGFSITSDQTQFSGTLIDTLFTTSTVTGCDSNVILTLTINPLKTTEWSQTVCDSFTWNSSTYYSTGDYVQNFFTTKGCDSTVTLHLTVNYTAPTTFIFDTVCQGNPYSNYGFVVSADSTNTPGVFSDTLYTSRVLTGCDSTVILNLTINPVKTTEWSQTVCDSIIWNSSTYYSTGDYVQHFLTEKGCDSTVTLHLTVNYSAPTTFIFDTICQGNPYSNYGFIISADSTDFSGILLDTLNTSRVLTGCDSTVILNLTINPIKTTEWSQTVCDSFTWNSSTYYTTGDYVQHFFTDKGCDSTVTLHLTVNYTAPTTFIFDTICQGNPYSNYGFVVPIDSTNTPEIFSDTIFTSCILTGCDSTVILNLTINPIKTTEWSQTICDSFTWNSSTYYTTGDYVQHFFTDKGCDSTVTLHLTINYTAPTTFIFDTICQGNSYSNYGFIVPIDSTNTPGIFTDTLNTSRVLTGCDSTVILNLTINPVKTTEWSQTICDSFTWNSSTYYSTGDYVQHFFTDKGCDSTVTLHLMVNYTSPTTYILDTICQGNPYSNYGFDVPIGSTNTPGIFSDTLHTSRVLTGCDSTVILNLTINPVKTTEYSQTVCDSFIWNSSTYYRSGNYVQHFLTEKGCDSTVTLHLTVNYSAPVSYYFGTICQGSGYTGYGFNIPAANTLVPGTLCDTLYSVCESTGCDSVSILTLTIRPTKTSEFYHDVCDSFRWNDSVYYTSGDYVQYFSTNEECDSIVTLHLIIRSSSPITHIYDSICPDTEYDLYGFFFPQEQTHLPRTINDTLFLFSNQTGCDSIVILSLTINAESDTTYIQDHICYGDTYLQYGFNLPNLPPGTSTFLQHAYDRHGCDSIVILTLNVLLPVSTHLFDTICQHEPYSSFGFNIPSSANIGTFNYFAHYNSRFGCDSTVFLSLTIKEVPQTTHLYDTICQGSGYTDFGFNISSDSTNIAGNYTYIQSLFAANHCDSIIYLHLTINPKSDTLFISDYICFRENYTLHGFNIIRPNAGIRNYVQVLTNQYGCDSIVFLTLNVHFPITTRIFDTICQYSSYQENGFNTLPYDTIGIFNDFRYEQTIYGCDSIILLTLTVKATSPTVYIYDTICQGYPYQNHNFTISSDSTSIPGSFIYQNTDIHSASGCDSTTILMLTINPTKRTSVFLTSCDSIIYNNIKYYQSGEYYQYFLTNKQCDSIVTLHITINETAPITLIHDTICQGGSYLLNGFSIVPPLTLRNGLLTDTLYAYRENSGCDSIIILQLLVKNMADTTFIHDAICQGMGYNYHGFNLGRQYIPGTFEYNRTYVAQNGCDSIVILSLSVNQTYTTRIYDTICQHTIYQENGFNLSYLNTAGEYDFFLYTSSQEGCDSLILLTLTVEPVSDDTHIFASICQGEVYQQYGFNIPSDSTLLSGIYYFNNLYLNQYGCDSLVILTLTINPLSDTTQLIDNICVGEPYYEYGFQIDAPIPGQSTHIQHLINQFGCDSIVQLSLSVHSPNTTQIIDTICQYEPYIANGFSIPALNNPGLHHDYFTINNQFGCDSVVLLTLLVQETPPVTYIFDTICQNNPYNDFGFFIPQNRTNIPGTINDTLFLASTITGCDSTVILNLTIHPNYQIRFNATACDSYRWNDSIYYTSGEYTQYFLSQFGCDSVVTLDLNMNYTLPITYIFDTICQNNPYNDFGFFIPQNRTNMPGTVNDTLFLNSTVTGCDSTVILHLTIHPNYQIRFNATACDSYRWNDSVYNTSGEYTQYFLSQFGCDSVVTLDLTINYTLPITYIFDTVCQNNPYNDFGFFISTNRTALPGTVNDTLFLHSTITGCDSTIILNLTIHPNYQIRFNATACDSYTWNDSVYNTSGEYTQYFLSQFGCDSIVTLDLTINYTLPITYIFDTVCQNNPYNDFGFFIPTNRTALPGTINDTLFLYSTITGCDSTVVLHLTIHPNYQMRFNATACDSYTWNDSVYNTSGEYTQYFLSQFGCDSIVTLNLTINYTLPITYIFDTICQNNPYNDFGFFISENRTDIPGRVNDTLFLHSTITGCDSTVVLQLTIHPNYEIRFNATACDSYTWNDSVYYTSGEYTQYFLTQFGCDSIVTLDLTINYTLPITYIFDTICQNNPYNDFGFFIPENRTSIPRTVNDTLFLHSTMTGCDSIVILQLTIHPNYQIRFNATACDSYTWNDSVYYTSGEYTQYFLSQFGCDSVVTLDLTINYTLPVTYIFDTVCQNNPYNDFGFFIPENITSIPGTVNDTLFLHSTITGCDSTMILNLTIHPNYQRRFSIVSCDRFIWNDSIYTLTGEYTQYFLSQFGCDSVVTLDLTINQTLPLTYIFDTICQNQPYNNWGFVVPESLTTIPGVLSDTLFLASTMTGCDSNVVLHLTIHPNYQIRVEATSCDSFAWNDSIYYISGEYTQYFLSQFGCDSVVTLNLTINYYSENHLFVTACEEYRWDVTSHTYTETGEYLYTTQNQYGCDSLITLHLTIHLPVSHEINIIETDSYLWELTGDTYYESGTYSYTLYGGSANGCDSTIILNLTIDTSSIGISSPEGFFASTVLLYPNPASSSINISTQIGEELVWIKLYDVSGKELYTIEGIKHNMITIPVDIYAKGLYFVKIKTNREEIIKKLIIR